jgi:hypothetical protein
MHNSTGAQECLLLAHSGAQRYFVLPNCLPETSLLSESKKADLSVLHQFELYPEVLAVTALALGRIAI